MIPNGTNSVRTNSLPVTFTDKWTPNISFNQSSSIRSTTFNSIYNDTETNSKNTPSDSNDNSNIINTNNNIIPHSNLSVASKKLAEANEVNNSSILSNTFDSKQSNIIDVEKNNGINTIYNNIIIEDLNKINEETTDKMIQFSKNKANMINIDNEYVKPINSFESKGFTISTDPESKNYSINQPDIIFPLPFNFGDKPIYSISFVQGMDFDIYWTEITNNKISEILEKLFSSDKEFIGVKLCNEDNIFPSNKKNEKCKNVTNTKMFKTDQSTNRYYTCRYLTIGNTRRSLVIDLGYISESKFKLSFPTFLSEFLITHNVYIYDSELVSLYWILTFGDTIPNYVKDLKREFIDKDYNVPLNDEYLLTGLLYGYDIFNEFNPETFKGFNPSMIIDTISTMKAVEVDSNTLDSVQTTKEKCIAMLSSCSTFSISICKTNEGFFSTIPNNESELVELVGDKVTIKLADLPMLIKCPHSIPGNSAELKIIQDFKNDEKRLYVASSTCKCIISETENNNLSTSLIETTPTLKNLHSGNYAMNYLVKILDMCEKELEFGITTKEKKPFLNSLTNDNNNANTNTNNDSLEKKSPLIDYTLNESPSKSIETQTIDSMISSCVDLAAYKTPLSAINQVRTQFLEENCNNSKLFETIMEPSKNPQCPISPSIMLSHSLLKTPGHKNINNFPFTENYDNSQNENVFIKNIEIQKNMKMLENTPKYEEEVRKIKTYYKLTESDFALCTPENLNLTAEELINKNSLIENKKHKRDRCPFRNVEKIFAICPICGHLKEPDYSKGIFEPLKFSALQFLGHIYMHLLFIENENTKIKKAKDLNKEQENNKKISYRNNKYKYPPSFNELNENTNISPKINHKPTENETYQLIKIPEFQCNRTSPLFIHGYHCPRCIKIIEKYKNSLIHQQTKITQKIANTIKQTSVSTSVDINSENQSPQNFLCKSNSNNYLSKSKSSFIGPISMVRSTKNLQIITEETDIDKLYYHIDIINSALNDQSFSVIYVPAYKKMISSTLDIISDGILKYFRFMHANMNATFYQIINTEFIKNQKKLYINKPQTKNNLPTPLSQVNDSNFSALHIDTTFDTDYTQPIKSDPIVCEERINMIVPENIKKSKELTKTIGFNIFLEKQKDNTTERINPNLIITNDLQLENNKSIEERLKQHILTKFSHGGVQYKIIIPDDPYQPVKIELSDENILNNYKKNAQKLEKSNSINTVLFSK